MSTAESSIVPSFCPGEVVSPGTPLKFSLDRPVDQATIPGTIRVLQSRSTVRVPATLSEDGKLVQIATDGLQEGDASIIIDDLRDTDGERFDGPINIPFNLAVFLGPLPANTRVEHSVLLASNDVFTTRISRVADAAPGQTVVQILKAVDTTTNNPTMLGFNRSGIALNPVNFYQTLQRGYANKYGRLDPALHERLQTMAPNQFCKVAIWPTVAANAFSYEKPLTGPPRLPPGASVATSALSAAKIALISTLRGLGVPIPTVANLPYVSVSLSKAFLQTASTVPGIGRIGLNEPDDLNIALAQSMKISRADVVQNPPSNVTGKLIHVAHFEWGPLDLSNLSFDGRYTNNPDPAFQGRVKHRMPNEKHARFTAGVIKNQEPGKPHGYAPDCELYSANDGTDEALIWSLLDPQLCTVVSKSFDRGTESTSPWPVHNDWFTDICALNWPWPTIVVAAGNYPVDPATGQINTAVRHYVANKSFNTITVGSHDDAGKAIMPWSVYENPKSANGDRELPHLSANGDSVQLLGESHSGTSFLAPAVAGTVALIQSVDSTLQMWPEACRAILFASANKSISGKDWWTDVSSNNPKVDGRDGAGTLNADKAVLVAKSRINIDATTEVDSFERGWDVRNANDASFGSTGGSPASWSRFRYFARMPPLPATSPLNRFFTYHLKVALSWSAKFINDPGSSLFQPAGFTDTIMDDLDLLVWDSHGKQVAFSASLDNNYEIVEFQAKPGETYQIIVRRTRGRTPDVWLGVAWCFHARNRVILPPVPPFPFPGTGPVGA